MYKIFVCVKAGKFQFPVVTVCPFIETYSKYIVLFQDIILVFCTKLHHQFIRKN